MRAYQEHNDKLSRVVSHSLDSRLGLRHTKQPLRRGKAFAFENVLLKLIPGIFVITRRELLDVADSGIGITVVCHVVHALSELSSSSQFPPRARFFG